MPRSATAAPEAPEMAPCRLCGKPSPVSIDDPVPANREWAICDDCRPGLAYTLDRQRRGLYPFDKK